MRSVSVFPAIVAVLMAMASAGGLCLDGLYRDNALVASSWRGNDLVTLAVAVPTLTVSLMLATRGSCRAMLVLLGMLAYATYNYAFYLFGARFNSFFLLYAATYTLAIFGLIFHLAELDAAAVAALARKRLFWKWASIWLLVVASALGGFWIFSSLDYVLTGKIPPIVLAVQGQTNVIAALDLSMVVSFAILGAVWLWQGRIWGYVLAVVWNVKGAVYMLALSAASVAAYRAGTAPDLLQIALWGPIGAGCLLTAVLLLADFSLPSRTEKTGRST